MKLRKGMFGGGFFRRDCSREEKGVQTDKKKTK